MTHTLQFLITRNLCIQFNKQEHIYCQLRFKCINLLLGLAIYLIKAGIIYDFFSLVKVS